MSSANDLSGTPGAGLSGCGLYSDVEFEMDGEEVEPGEGGDVLELELELESDMDGNGSGETRGAAAVGGGPAHGASLAHTCWCWAATRSHPAKVDEQLGAPPGDTILGVGGAEPWVIGGTRSGGWRLKMLNKEKRECIGTYSPQSVRTSVFKSLLDSWARDLQIPNELQHIDPPPAPATDMGLAAATPEQRQVLAIASLSASSSVGTTPGNKARARRTLGKSETLAWAEQHGERRGERCGQRIKLGQCGDVDGRGRLQCCRSAATGAGAAHRQAALVAVESYPRMIPSKRPRKHQALFLMPKTRNRVTPQQIAQQSSRPRLREAIQRKDVGQQDELGRETQKKRPSTRAATGSAQKDTMHGVLVQALALEASSFPFTFPFPFSGRLAIPACKFSSCSLRRGFLSHSLVSYPITGVWPGMARGRRHRRSRVAAYLNARNALGWHSALDLLAKLRNPYNDGAGYVYIFQCVPRTIFLQYESRQITRTAFLTASRVKVGHTNDLKRRRREYKKCEIDWVLTWRIKIWTPCHMLLESLMHASLHDMGATVPRVRCSCKKIHRELFGLQAAGGVRGVVRIARDWLRLIGQQKKSIITRFAIENLIGNFKFESVAHRTHTYRRLNSALLELQNCW
ncbi:hypothetical protein B0H13DRAFT_1914355 [Mycena leptocephala]|nr:hypothetical protein B0H13DRAFT_1914355 [Mycena leptocephala]